MKKVLLFAIACLLLFGLFAGVALAATPTAVNLDGQTYLLNTVTWVTPTPVVGTSINPVLIGGVYQLAKIPLPF